MVRTVFKYPWNILAQTFFIPKTVADVLEILNTWHSSFIIDNEW